MLQIEIYEEFSHWLDDLLENNTIPEDAKAFCFNLYEESAEDCIYAVQLIASGEFDETDDSGEWACEEVWSSEENIFCIDTSDEDEKGWQHARDLYREMVEEYIKTGTHRRMLTSLNGIGIGFVDGDLELIK